MATPNAVEINITNSQREILEQISKGRNNKKNLVERSKIILKSFDGMSNLKISESIPCARNTVKKWRERWFDFSSKIYEIEIKDPKNLKSAIIKFLEDLPRPGSPPKFTEEQVAKIQSLSCKSPEQFGIPISHWTVSALQKEVISQKIVESISISKIDCILKRRQK